MATDKPHYRDLSGEVYLKLNDGDNPVQFPEPVSEEQAKAAVREASAETLRDVLPQQVTETLRDALPQLEKDNKSKFAAVKGLVAVFGLFKDASVANAHKEEQDVERSNRPNGRNGR